MRIRVIQTPATCNHTIHHWNKICIVNRGGEKKGHVSRARKVQTLLQPRESWIIAGSLGVSISSVCLRLQAERILLQHPAASIKREGSIMLVRRPYAIFSSTFSLVSTFLLASTSHIVFVLFLLIARNVDFARFTVCLQKHGARNYA